MPSKSKSQQRFMGMVHALQKGEIKPSKVSDKIKKVAKSIDYDDADDFASTKHKGLPNKVKRESRVKSLIRKMVREVMDEIDEGFAGGLPKGKRKAFDKMRQKQSEVLGYKLTGTNDMKVETDDATVHEGKLKEDFKNNEWEVYVADEKGKEKIVKVAKSKRAGVILYNKLINSDKFHEVGMRVIKEGKLTEKVKYKKDKKIGGEWYTKQGTHKHQMKANVLAKREFGRYYDTKVVKEKGGYTIYVKPLKEGKLTEKKMDRKKAAIILKQIGGNRFIAMTGAKGFAFSDKYMSFKIGRNSKGINFVRIGHNAMDTYDMEFGFVSVKGIKVKKKVKGVYADMLGTMFKKYTGMNVSL